MSQGIPTRLGRKKSSHSGGGNDCVEVEVTASGSVFGDTKAEATECFTLSAGAHNGLLASLRYSLITA